MKTMVGAATGGGLQVSALASKRRANVSLHGRQGELWACPPRLLSKKMERGPIQMKHHLHICNQSSLFFGDYRGRIFSGFNHQFLRLSKNSIPYQTIAKGSDHKPVLDLDQSTDSPAYRNLGTERRSLTNGKLSLGHAGVTEVSHNQGKTGLVTFYKEAAATHSLEQAEPSVMPPLSFSWLSLTWLVGPAVLVLSLVLPPLYLRKFFGLLFEDSLATDFLVLFFAEAFFYAGVSIFFYVAHKIRQSAGVFSWSFERGFHSSYKLLSIATLIIGVLLPTGTFTLVWPWIGPAAAAALIPYVIGLGVQFAFEKFTRERKSPVIPLIPVVFQVYRLHQLNRAAQFIAGLTFSLKGAEVTAEMLAINGSLQTLMLSVQILGMISLWSLASFLIQAFPLKRVSEQSTVLP